MVACSMPLVLAGAHEQGRLVRAEHVLGTLEVILPVRGRLRTPQYSVQKVKGPKGLHEHGLHGIVGLVLFCCRAPCEAHRQA